MTRFEIIARARGYELKENAVVNKGFYCVPVGGRDDSPTTYPTREQAWEACCKDNGLGQAVKHVCSKCGGEDVMLDAWAEWDITTQEWVLKQTFDNAYCESCEGECSVEEVDVTEEDVDDE